MLDLLPRNLELQTLNLEPFAFPNFPIIFALLLKHENHVSNQIKAKRP